MAEKPITERWRVTTTAWRTGDTVDATVEITLDMHYIVGRLARRAIGNKTQRTTAEDGAIKVKVVTVHSIKPKKKPTTEATP